MKTLAVRLPESIMAEMDAESHKRKVSKSDIVRERLRTGRRAGRPRSPALDSIADLIGSVDGLPADLSARTKAYLRTILHGRKRPR
jgi:hypothetical protein